MTYVNSPTWTVALTANLRFAGKEAERQQTYIDNSFTIIEMGEYKYNDNCNFHFYIHNCVAQQYKNHTHRIFILTKSLFTVVLQLQWDIKVWIENF